MSQVARLVRVRHHGAPVFLGFEASIDEHGDETQHPAWSGDGNRVAKWMADGFRVRFNQRRSLRKQYLTCTDRAGEHCLVRDPAGEPVRVPVGRTVTDLTDAQARRAYPHLAAMPGYVLEATLKTESDDWFAAVKRRKTNTASGRKAGKMPRFRSAKRDDARFVCWFNGGRNAVFTKTGRRSGMVTITGQNPTEYRQPGLAPDGTPNGLRWRVTLHVRLSQDIRAYTPVRVNLTRREVVFVNEPLAVTDRAGNGEAVGIDRGVAHTAADSNGSFYDAPDTSALEKERRWHAQRMSKSRLIAEREGRKFWESNGYQAHKAEAARLAARIARIREDYAHKLSTEIVRVSDFIGIENLRLPNMTRKGRGKRGLNRAIANAALGRVAAFLEYKARLAGIPYVQVDPAHTSQRCHQCGHTCPENRESQAVFRCLSCAWTGNADTNAAINIRDAALELWVTRTGQDNALAGSKGRTDPRTGPRCGAAAPAMNREPSSPAAA